MEQIVVSIDKDLTSDLKIPKCSISPIFINDIGYYCREGWIFNSWEVVIEAIYLCHKRAPQRQLYPYYRQVEDQEDLETTDGWKRLGAVSGIDGLTLDKKP